MNNDRFDGTDGNGYQPKHDDRIAGSSPPPKDRPEPPPAPPIAELKFERSNFLAAAAFLDRNMEGLIAYQRVISRLSRERYVALLTVGFSEAQALELIKSPLF